MPLHIAERGEATKCFGAGGSVAGPVHHHSEYVGALTPVGVGYVTRVVGVYYPVKTLDKHTTAQNFGPVGRSPSIVLKI